MGPFWATYSAKKTTSSSSLASGRRNYILLSSRTANTEHVSSRMASFISLHLHEALCVVAKVTQLQAYVYCFTD